jgi:hypothetical protein
MYKTKTEELKKIEIAETEKKKSVKIVGSK